jgi:hypothetical protein
MGMGEEMAKLGNIVPRLHGLLVDSPSDLKLYAFRVVVELCERCNEMRNMILSSEILSVICAFLDVVENEVSVRFVSVLDTYLNGLERANVVGFLNGCDFNFDSMDLESGGLREALEILFSRYGINVST